jgi:hypothetical protein
MHAPRVVALGAVLLTPVVAHGPRPAQPASYTYQGTVHAVAPRQSSLELITGVGFALRLVQLHAVAATRIDSAGVALPLADLKPGAVVRAACRRTNLGLVADHIEKLDGAVAR